MSERKSLLKTIMEMEDISSKEAQKRINDCRADLYERLAEGEMPDDILEEWFGLEPDWLDELM